MKTVTLKMPPDLADWLERKARELNQPKSELVRNALFAMREQSGENSVLARAGDLVGRFASGRHDSSHKKHLKSFGK
jgi:hypothetical protein